MFQKLQVIGYLGGDPDLRYTSNGNAVCNFSVATNRSFTNSEGTKVEETVWFRLTTWNKLAENCNTYLRKGRKVYAEGRLQGDENGNPKIWTKSDGTPAATNEMTAGLVIFLSDRSEDGVPDDVDAVAQAQADGEDIPF
jgi:single-strand DNA-binding protein